MIQLVPIVLFTYLRLDSLKKTVSALSNNSLAAESDLIVFSDGSKSLKDDKIVLEVRAYLKTIKGFKSIKIHESRSNKGLAASIIHGVSEVLKFYPSAIVLEDDLITSTNFLAFMNQALDYYKDKPEILAVSGFSPRIKGLRKDEVYFTHRASSWGWACWEDRWSKIDWNCEYYDEFKESTKLKSKFNEMGSDMSLMMKRQMEGKLNSWAIRFCFNQFQQQLYSVHPAISKIQNIGFSDELATNTYQKFNRFSSNLDNSGNEEFVFNNEISLDPNVIKQFIKDNSIEARIMNKLLNLFK
jgi:hypothetical protein